MDGFAFPGQNVETVVGNGRLVARARAGSATFVFGGPTAGLRLLAGGIPLDERPLDTRARPGRSVYHAPGLGTVTHAAAPDALLYVVAVEADKKLSATPWTLDVTAEAVRADRASLVTPGGRVFAWGGAGKALVGEPHHGALTVSLRRGGRAAFLLGTEDAITDFLATGADPHEAAAAWEQGYRDRGLRLRSPDARLNLAVDFMKYHLQLGYDWRPTGEPGEKLVCDVFRWRDVWSRDLGSGLGPGALVAGMFGAVEDTLDYEVARYTAHPVGGWKVSDDTSQGGSVESLGWVMKLVWRHYKHTGDRAFLARMVAAFEPWIEGWISRDADDDGLVADVTEWMDHSRFLRLPEGQRTLYANVLYYAALRRFRFAKAELGDEYASERYHALSTLTRVGIHEAFWNEAGYFDNATAWGVRDTALMLADNAVAVAERVASRNERFRILAAIRERCWRNFGTVTCDLPMKYVPPENDHNVKVWPWWMAHEARARLVNQDVDGGFHVLGKILDTLERPTFPGLCEEYLHPDDGSQDDVGGHAFLTGAGATLEAILGGVVGISLRSAGEAALRLAPQVPRAWAAWSASVQLFEGRLLLEQAPDGYRVTLDGTRVETLELRVPPSQGLARATLDGVEVDPIRQEDGASEYVLFLLTPGLRQTVEVRFAPSRAGLGDFAMPAELPAPIAAARPALMDEPRLFADVLQQFIVNAVSYFGQVRHVAARELPELERAAAGGGRPLLVVVGNEMPYRTKRGEPVPPMLDAYLDAGGPVLLLGPRFGRVDIREDFHGPRQMGGKAGRFWWKVWQGGRWVDYDPHHDAVTAGPEHNGAVYWGPGPLFAAWEHRHGLFGFETPCVGVFDVEGRPVDPGQTVDIVYTDWAVQKPWKFFPLAFTDRAEPVVTGPRAERYPCAALLANEATGARIVVVAPALCARADLLHRILAHVVTPVRQRAAAGVA